MGILVSSVEAYYQPESGRFMQRDQLEVNPTSEIQNPFGVQNQYKEGANVYQYVGCNPMHMVDPLGLSGYYPIPIPTPTPTPRKSPKDEYEQDQRELGFRWTRVIWDTKNHCVQGVDICGHGTKEGDIVIGDGEDQANFMPKYHLPNALLCCNVRILLKTCYTGSHTDKMKKIGQDILRRNPGKTITICGCTGQWIDTLGSIPGMPQWNCILGFGYCEGSTECIKVQ
jgi:RHS repeat-associated protein